MATKPRLEVYQSPQDEQWRWRLRARNREIVADSAESYTLMKDARRAATQVQKLMLVAEQVQVSKQGVDVTDWSDR